ncbi:MAG: peptidylprolyl isomerase [Myxococcales bacterium]|jgi:peptidyl-prolyl cis-trans isomerase A (cyclophilin A)
MRTVAVFLLAGAFLAGCPKNEEAQTKSGSEESSAATPTAKPEEGPQRAPDRYTVELDTTKGPIVIDVHRDWAPRGADRFYELVEDGYFTDLAFFRVIGGFMAQVGISGDPALSAKWRQKTIPDDPVKASNTRGTVTFATSGPDSRTTQFFINFADNSRLDAMGFAPFGKVRDMEPVDALYDGYGEGAPRGRGPSQGLIQSQGNDYLRKNFPKLDYIKSAKILE